MRKSTKTLKNLKIEFHYWKSYIRTAEQLSMKINDIEICIFGPRCIRIVESIVGRKFTTEETFIFVADTFKVDKYDLYINDTYITDMDYMRMCAIHGALHEVTNYSISICCDTLVYGYSFSHDWHVSNRSSYIETVETTDLESTMKELKEKYALLVEHNKYYSFRIIEERGEDFNRVLKYDSVGLDPDNFDEEIRKEIFR